MHQTDYVMSLLTEHEMLACVPKFIPVPDLVKLRKDTCTARVDPLAFQHIIGQLNYLTKTRWEFGFSVTLLSRYMHQPEEAHMEAAFSVLQYLRRYPSVGLWSPKGEDFRLSGFSYAHYGGDLNERISTRAYLFMMGQTPISWCSKTEFPTLDHRANPSIEPWPRQRAKQHG